MWQKPSYCTETSGMALNFVTISRWCWGIEKVYVLLVYDEWREAICEPFIELSSGEIFTERKTVYTKSCHTYVALPTDSMVRHLEKAKRSRYQQRKSKKATILKA